MMSIFDKSSTDFVATETVGGFNNGNVKNTFDEVFQEAQNSLLTGSINIMSDINDIIKKKTVLGDLKDQLLGELKTECENMIEKEQAGEGEFGTHKYLYEQVSQMFDNCVEDLVAESTRVGNLLPIKAIDFPILIKQQLKLATKDIMQTEITKTPIVKKHIEQVYVVDSNNPKNRWKYPQCFFDDSFKEIYLAGKGLQIKDTVVSLPQFDYDVVANLTDAVDPSKEIFTFDLQIPTIVVGGEKFNLKRPMRINLSDNMWLGGVINDTFTKADGTTVDVKDVVSGSVDFTNHTVTLSSAAGVVEGVVFSGFLSNEKNTRSVTFDYNREEIEWKIEDGMKAQAAYSLEQLEDTKALLDMDLYQKSYNNMSDFMVQMEDSKILQWLDEQYDKYKGIEISLEDIRSWEGFISEKVFDCDTTTITTALPNEYIEKMLKFQIDGFITDMCDKAKLEDMTFVIYGNPKLVRLLNPVVNWVTRPGSTMNGVKLDYGYGIMNSNDVKVQVISTKKVESSYDEDDQLFRGLRLIPFPLNPEQFTFRHYKYTTHILTNQNSAYRPNVEEFPGGAMTYLVGVSRYTNAVVQGIQGEISFANAEPYVMK